MVLYIAPLETNAVQPPKYVCESVARSDESCWLPCQIT